MSFGHHTPESLLPRSDSKNPAATCKGITTTGRPCRRGLTSPSTSPTPSPSRDHGVLAVLQDGTDSRSNAAAFYCWQHRDQADRLVATDTTKTKLYPLKEKSSIDTLVDRLGVLDLEEDASPKHKRKRRKHDQHTLKKRDTLPAGWHDMQGPLMTVPEGFGRSGYEQRLQKIPTYGRSNLKASFLCCLRTDDEDLPPARRPKNQHRPVTNEAPPCMDFDASYDNARPARTHLSMQTPPQVHRKPVASPTASAAPSPSSRPRLNGLPPQTQSILSLIPNTLQPQIVAALLAEIARPLTDNDIKTSGYIYIFWLTPETEGDGPDSDVASTILDDASPGRGNIQDQMLERYSSKRRKSSTGRHLSGQRTKTALLKIGRATNVHRRMTQWQKQCGHNITLLRYYPNTSGSNTTTPEPVPLLPRVERLVQIELADLRIKQDKCQSCGREHREWFEVDANRKAIQTVDECVRRWVNWGREESVKPGRAKQARAQPDGYF